MPILYVAVDVSVSFVGSTGYYDKASTITLQPADVDGVGSSSGEGTTSGWGRDRVLWKHTEQAGGGSTLS